MLTRPAPAASVEWCLGFTSFSLYMSNAIFVIPIDVNRFIVISNVHLLHGLLQLSGMYLSSWLHALEDLGWYQLLGGSGCRVGFAYPNSISLWSWKCAWRENLVSVVIKP